MSIEVFVVATLLAFVAVIVVLSVLVWKLVCRVTAANAETLRHALAINADELEYMRLKVAADSSEIMLREQRERDARRAGLARPRPVVEDEPVPMGVGGGSERVAD